MLTILPSELLTLAVSVDFTVSGCVENFCFEDVNLLYSGMNVILYHI